MSDQISLEYGWNDENSVGPHATAKGSSGSLCDLTSTVQGALLKALVRKDEDYYPMAEMLADCFCSNRIKNTGLKPSKDNNYGIQMDYEYHRTDLRILDFIRSAVEEKLNNDQFMDKFVKENY